MLKRLDLYIIKTFLGPFFFIFSVLFFILMVNVVWIQIFNLGGKGLSFGELTKFFFYISVGVVKMVLPLTIFLTSIMTFGDFGERYELAAMKSAGMSLWRIMRPLLITCLGLAGLLFLFSNYIIPDFQRKSKNMLYNIISMRPALNFTPGQFIETIPGMAIKFDKTYGENNEFIEGVFIRKTAGAYEDQRSIVAKKGQFISKEGSNYLKLVLYNGYIFEENTAKYDIKERQRQENQSIKFDTLVSHIDISELLDKAIESENVGDSYEFHSFLQLNSTIKDIKKIQQEEHLATANEFLINVNFYLENLGKDSTKTIGKIERPFILDTLKPKKKLEILEQAYDRIEELERLKNEKNEGILDTTKYYVKAVMYQQQILAYSVMSVIFFLIGASLGSIVRKGGIGLPIIFAIVIFTIFHVMNLTAENFAWKGELDPYIAAWLPNMIFFPISIWISIKAINDSQIFDIEKYKALINPIIKKLSSNKEHKRYQ
ncbi:MAG: LptF/LptG family permease [Flavobacteriaceae bacterium]|nr:LptF/LptG family permease [Flavobacteriaceae bacterium]